MNSRYIGCRQCKCFINAGYRFAYWQLECTNIVSLGQKIDLSSLLEANSFWNPPLGVLNDWLCSQILPALRHFLFLHAEHELIYLEEDMLLSDLLSAFADWEEVKLQMMKD